MLFTAKSYFIALFYDPQRYLCVNQIAFAHCARRTRYVITLVKYAVKPNNFYHV